MTPEGPLDVLLVEDNPGDARYIRELLTEATELSERTFGSAHADIREDPNDSGAEGLTLHHETRLSAGVDSLETAQPDIVLLDLDLPDSRGLETLETVLDHAESVPVVVLTGISDRETGLEAFRRGAEEFLVKDEITADLLVRSIYHAIERKANERHLEAQRERLEVLNQLHVVFQEIIDAVVEQSTREEIQETVVEQLAAAPSYEFAWIGEVDATTDTVAVRAKAGGEGYLDDVTISVDPDDERGQGPTGTAVRTGEIQVQTHLTDDPAFEPWQGRAADHGYNSSVAIPIVHEGTMYGVINVYSARPEGSVDEEREVLARLGEVVGHAIAAVERKRTLMSDEVVEVDVGIPDVRPPAADGVEQADRISLDRAVPVDDEYHVYGTASSDDVPVVEALVDAVPHWEAVDVVAEDGDSVTVELELSGPSILTLIAGQGGAVKSATVGDEGLRVTAQFPHDVAVRQVLDAIQGVYPSAEVQAQRLVERTDDWSDRVLSAFEETLTDRQRAILETAYFRGYFEWPRESSGEEIADSVDLSPPTFSEHLRGAENRIFEALFEDREPGDDD